MDLRFEANFTANRITICEGDSINFADNSFHNVISWDWTFSGGMPLNSNAQNPVITYNNAGTYEVSLTASNGASSLTDLKLTILLCCPLADCPSLQ